MKLCKGIVIGRIEPDDVRRTQELVLGMLVVYMQGDQKVVQPI
jgi:hypothetical protein